MRVEPLHQLGAEVNIGAEPHVIVRDGSRTVLQLMHDASSDADVVSCGLKLPQPEEDADYAEWLFRMAMGFATPFCPQRECLCRRIELICA